MPTPTPTATGGAPSFPSTGVLDNFDRANGSIGSSWDGQTSGYQINSNRLDDVDDDDIYRTVSAFGADQEVYCSLREITPGGLLPGLGAQRYTYNTAGYLEQVETHDGAAYQTRAEMQYDGMGQRLEQTVYEAGFGLTTNYVIDPLADARPLRASAAGQDTWYLYGLGPLGEKNAAWSYYLPDGLNTVRQLSDPTGQVTLYRGFTPWGEVLEQQGEGDFAWGYFGGLMDAATGLIYVGGGQYYDPATGRFLTRQTQPGKMNPYTPWGWDPIGAMLGPMVLLLFLRRGKKPGKYDRLLTGMILLIAFGTSLVACTMGGEPPVNTATSTQVLPTQPPPTANTRITPLPRATNSATPTQSYIKPTLSPACTPSGSPRMSPTLLPSPTLTPTQPLDSDAVKYTLPWSGGEIDPTTSSRGKAAYEKYLAVLKVLGKTY